MLLKSSPRITVRYIHEPFNRSSYFSQKNNPEVVAKIYDYFVFVPGDFFIGNEYEGDPVVYFPYEKEGKGNCKKNYWEASGGLDWEHILPFLFQQDNRVGIYTNSPSRAVEILKKKRRFSFFYFPEKYEY
ncbi:MAG: hypothetical protein PHF35_01640 [Candidatus Moranbacteria bacterium]|nr:hypothetical protein [Candidatus Moranbacteria bacterium]